MTSDIDVAMKKKRCVFATVNAVHHGNDSLLVNGSERVWKNKEITWQQHQHSMWNIWNNSYMWTAVVDQSEE